MTRGTKQLKSVREGQPIEVLPNPVFRKQHCFLNTGFAWPWSRVPWETMSHGISRRRDFRVRVGRVMDPAGLLTGTGKDLFQSGPESLGAVIDFQPRINRETSPFQSQRPVTKRRSRFPHKQTRPLRVGCVVAGSWFSRSSFSDGL